MSLTLIEMRVTISDSAMFARLKAGEGLCLGGGRNSKTNSIAGVKSGAEEAVHFTVQKL